ncbi:site-2 protease family protein [Roseovarius rhodophyticola]|uniref:Zinc metalloprotease n=1 Tax=Roseovarius rhodophyticola TaxID=3080827 RepID=A0ABZ2TIV7_9RHOB|nr:site-2 protease family protein [Roseovarius sp. W115]MDV2928279.1 site-2 protease family protein [Roseovarius sp. W115]
MFKNARPVLNLLGFEIKIDPSWLLIAALITWSLSQHTFPVRLPEAASSQHFTMAVATMLLFFASLLLHEVAHAVVARSYGVATRGITLFLFGGVAEIESEPKAASHEFYIAVAGPLMSFFLAFLFWILLQISTILSGPKEFAAVFSYLALINLILALFNLLPAFPLDGGRILRAYLWKKSGNMLRATQTASKSGEFLAFTLIVLGIMTLYNGFVVSGFWQVLLGFFLLAAAKTSYQNQLMQAAFAKRSVGTLMTKTPVITTDPDTTISDLIYNKILRSNVSFVPVVENKVLLGYIDTEVLSHLERENWRNTKVNDVFVELNPDNCITEDMPLSELMKKISETNRRKFLVSQNSTLTGVISLSDLMGYLGLISLLKLHNNGHETN